MTFADSTPESAHTGKDMHFLYLPGMAACSRYCFNGQACPAWFLALGLANTQLFKQGDTLFKVIYLTRDQGNELSFYIVKCFTNELTPGNIQTTEDTLPQWVRAVRL